MKIRIVRYDDGGNPGFVKAVLLRAIVNSFLGIIPGSAPVAILFIFGAEQLIIRDLLVGTKVVEAKSCGNLSATANFVTSRSIGPSGSQRRVQ